MKKEIIFLIFFIIFNLVNLLYAQFDPVAGIFITTGQKISSYSGVKKIVFPDGESIFEGIKRIDDIFDPYKEARFYKFNPDGLEFIASTNIKYNKLIPLDDSRLLLMGLNKSEIINIKEKKIYVTDSPLVDTGVSKVNMYENKAYIACRGNPYYSSGKNGSMFVDSRFFNYLNHHSQLNLLNEKDQVNIKEHFIREKIIIPVTVKYDSKKSTRYLINKKLPWLEDSFTINLPNDYNKYQKIVTDLLKKLAVTGYEYLMYFDVQTENFGIAGKYIYPKGGLIDSFIFADKLYVKGEAVKLVYLKDENCYEWQRQGLHTEEFDFETGKFTLADDIESLPGYSVDGEVRMWRGEDKYSLNVFDTKSGNIKHIKTDWLLPFRPAFIKLEDNKYLMVGGTIEKEDVSMGYLRQVSYGTDKAYVVDLDESTVREIPKKMKYARRFAHLVKWKEGEIYIIGGYRKENDPRMVEEVEVFRYPIE